MRWRASCAREDWRTARGVPCVAQATQAPPGLAVRAGSVRPRPQPYRTPSMPGGAGERPGPDREL